MKRTFSEFLLESVETDEYRAQKLAKQIRKDCARYLSIPSVWGTLIRLHQDYNKQDQISLGTHGTLRTLGSSLPSKANYKMLMRGFNSGVDSGLMQIPTGRKPKDTTIDIHNALDEYFFERFKIHFRSAAVFSSSSASQAATYAYNNAGIFIFPINGSKYCWSDTIHDATENLDPFAEFSDDNSEFNEFVTSEFSREPSSKNKKKIAEELKKWLKHNKNLYRCSSTTSGIENAIETGNEVMISCSKGYYAINQFEPIGMLTLLALGKILADEKDI